MKKLFLTIAIVIMTIPLYGQTINVGELNRLLASWPYNVNLTGTTTLTGDITLSGAITSNQSYAAAQTVFYFRSALTATSGEHNNVRGRAMNQAASGSTSDIRGVYGQATTTASLFGGTGTGVFANFIAKNLSTTVTGRALFAEAETEATPTALTNMYSGYFRTKAHMGPSGEYYMVMMEDELVSTGFAMDAYLGMKSTSWAGGNSATYGIDMNGVDGFTTGDWRMHNGTLFNNSSASLLTITEATVDIDGASTATSYTADAGISGVLITTTGFNQQAVVVTDAAAYDVLAANTGRIHLIGDLSQNTRIDLPAEAAGLIYEFWYIGGAAETHDDTLTSENDTNFFIGGVSFLDIDAGAGADEVHVGIYSDGANNSKLNLINMAAGTKIIVVCDGVNWYITGQIMADTVPAFANQ